MQVLRRLEQTSDLHSSEEGKVTSRLFGVYFYKHINSYKSNR